MQKLEVSGCPGKVIELPNFIAFTLHCTFAGKIANCVEELGAFHTGCVARCKRSCSCAHTCRIIACRSDSLMRPELFLLQHTTRATRWCPSNGTASPGFRPRRRTRCETGIVRFCLLLSPLQASKWSSPEGTILDLHDLTGNDMLVHVLLQKVVLSLLCGRAASLVNELTLSISHV